MMFTLFAQADLLRGSIYFLVVVLVCWVIWYALTQLVHPSRPGPGRSSASSWRSSA